MSYQRSSYQNPIQQNQTQQNLPFQIGTEGQYILYYSNYSIDCKEFMNILCKTPTYSTFKKINVSDGKTSFPPFVRHVPTIIVPKVNKPLVGEEAFDWLEQKSESRAKNSKESIIPFNPGEMGCGMGDSYSYLDVPDTEQPMEHSFSFIKRADQKIETPPEDSFIDTKPKPIEDINRSNRPPFPQANQMVAQGHVPHQNIQPNMQPSMQPNMQNGQPRETPDFTKPLSSNGVGGRGPMIPQNSGGSDENVEDAYNELLARRKMDIPNMPPRQ